MAFLVVRGDVTTREQTARELVGNGHVVTAGSCNDARSALRAGTFDAVVVDADLVDGSGFGVADLAAAHSGT